jgi:hypothetical protein
MASAFASAALAAARSSSMAEAVTMVTSAAMRRSAASIAARDKAKSAVSGSLNGRSIWNNKL